MNSVRKIDENAMFQKAHKFVWQISGVLLLNELNIVNY